MDPKSAAVVQQVIAKLQGLLGGGSSSGPKEAAIPEFDSNFAKCVEKAKTLSPQIQSLTNIYGTAAKYMKQILGFSTSCKKFSQQQQEQLKKKFMDLSKQTQDIQKKNMEHIDHCRAIRQLLSTTFWVFVPTPEFLLKGAIESADFSAMKFQKKKNQDVNEWYKLLQISVRSLEKYVLEGYPMGISFTGSNDSWGIILEGKIDSAPASKEEAPKPAPEVVKAPVVAAKKAKKREMVGLTYTITNFQGENIDLKQGQIEMKHGIYIENCKGMNLKIDPKFKSIVVSKCQDLNLILNTCVSGVQIVNSKNISVLVHERTPSISVDSSNTVKVVLNENHLECDIVSSKASQLTIAYEKGEGNESKPFTVGEQLITKWDANTKTFHTGVYDKFL